ncbi:hypothetical protein MKW98_006145, partial [Papaver atlanticum]
MDYTRKSYFLQQEQETYHFHHQEHPKKHSNNLHQQLPQLNTSFSSSLLDEIYKSFDETTSYNPSSCFEETKTITMKKKMMTQSCIAAPITTSSRTNNKHHSSVKGDHQQRDFVAAKEESGRMKQRNIVDKWVLEKKKKTKTKGNDQKLIVDLNNKINSRKKTAASVPVDTTHRYLHSTSSSSDSSSGGGFSSSETESVYGSRTGKSTKSSAAGSFFVRPIRTRGSSTVHHSEKSDQILRNHPSKSKTEDNEGRSGGGNGKAKSRAMKIYNDLIKVKQPISPGGKISSFLNSLFTPKKSSNDFPAPTTKTTKSTFTRTAPPVTAATPTCSSASSYSRSCLSKTPSLSHNGNLKQRSVRFYPVNIILDEHHHHQDSSKPSCREPSQPNHYNQKQQRTSNRISSEEEFKNKISEIKKNNQRFLVEEVIDIDKLLMANYQRKDEKNLKIEEENDDYDDDRASYASSDLFELDNLSTIGLEINAARFSEELPVYETTHFETNRAI